MALPLYLAQTAAEMAGNPLPRNTAFLSCRFSPGGQGLSNFPEGLPPCSILILDDSTPMEGHDPRVITEQLNEAVSRLGCEALLLDFQRPGNTGQEELTKMFTQSLPCPVAVSELYAGELDCPVFLPPLPPDKCLSEYLMPWAGREIWLEAALEGITLTLTEAGCSVEALYDFPEEGMEEDTLHCHYTVETVAESAIFRLWRTKADLENLLKEAEALNITKAIGLWQELGR